MDCKSAEVLLSNICTPICRNMYLRAETPMKFYQSRKKPAMSMLRAETPRLYEKNKENQSEYRADISHHHGPDELRAGLFFGDVQPLCVHRSDDRHGQAHQKTDAADKVEQKSHERQRKKYLPALRKALFFRRLDLFSAAGFIIFRRKFSVGGIRIRRRTVPTAVVSLPLRPDFCLVLVPRRGKNPVPTKFRRELFPAFRPAARSVFASVLSSESSEKCAPQRIQNFALSSAS